MESEGAPRSPLQRGAAALSTEKISQLPQRPEFKFPSGPGVGNVAVTRSDKAGLTTASPASDGCVRGNRSH